MADFNSVTLVGRLTRSPEIRQLPGGTSVCEFGLAVGRKFKTASGEQREERAFIDCSLFGKGGNVFSQYMDKGSQVLVNGRIKMDEWSDKTTGQKRTKLGVVVNDFVFLDSNKGGNRVQDRDPPHQDDGQSRQLNEDPAAETPSEDLPW